MSPISGLRSVVVAVLCLTAGVQLVRPCAAQGVRIIPLERIVATSQVVVIARLDKFVPDPAIPSTLPDRPQVGMTNRELNALSERRNIRRESGMNTFTVIERLKGDCPSPIELRTEPLSRYYYGSEDFSVADKEVCLLMFNPAAGQWSATESVLPLVPLGTGFAVPKELDPTDPITIRSVQRILITSLTDRRVQTSSLFFLSTIRDRDVEQAARQVWNDPGASPFARRNALECLAENQAIDMIPQIATFVVGPGALGTGHTSLRRYRTRDAIPALNECLTGTVQMAQANARAALQNIAKIQTIDTIIRSLRTTPDAYQVHWELHMLVPAMGTPRGVEHFNQHKEQEIAADERWWRQEQQVGAP